MRANKQIRKSVANEETVMWGGGGAQVCWTGSPLSEEQVHLAMLDTCLVATGQA